MAEKTIQQKLESKSIAYITDHEIPEEQLNPNPITLSTKYHVCIWHYEGDSVKALASLFRRSQSQIQEILDTCEKSGEYDAFIRRFNSLKQGGPKKYVKKNREHQNE